MNNAPSQEPSDEKSPESLDEELQKDPVANVMIDILALCYILFRDGRQDELQLLHSCAKNDETILGKPLFKTQTFLGHFQHLLPDKKLPKYVRDALLSVLRKNPDGTVTPINAITKQSDRTLQAKPFSDEEDG